nr:hypothetical protein [Tanacetum cinerariifolium]
KKKTYSKRRVKHKVTLSANDNNISNDLDAALELAKSISQAKAKEAEAARKVHATHARIVNEYAKKKSGGRSSKMLMIEVGERLVLFKEVVDDDFAELGIWHVLTS